MKEGFRETRRTLPSQFFCEPPSRGDFKCQGKCLNNEQADSSVLFTVGNYQILNRRTGSRPKTARGN